MANLVSRPNFWNFFDTYFDQEEHKYHGEDFAFCLKWRKIGGKCYCYLMDEVTHVGEHCYTGRFWDELYNTTKIDDSDKNQVKSTVFRTFVPAYNTIKLIRYCKHR
jgi:hypothetical protein